VRHARAASKSLQPERVHPREVAGEAVVPSYTRGFMLSVSPLFRSRVARCAPLLLGLASSCSSDPSPDDAGTAGSAGTSQAGQGGVAGSTASGGGAGKAGMTGSAGSSGVGGSSAAGGSGASGGAAGSSGGGAGIDAVGGSAGATGGTGGAGGTGPQAGGAGMPPVAGAAGESTAGAAGSGAGGSGGTPGNGFLSEDFEAGTVGMQPAGWDNFIAWNKNGANPSGDTLALVDMTRAKSGTKSLHVKGGSNPAQITRALADGTNKLYVRAWFYMSRQLGNHPENEANHETLIAIRKSTGGANEEVRFGEIKGVIGTNEVPSDNIAPTMDRWHTGPSVSADAWHCIEVAFLGDVMPNQLKAWADGMLVHEITSIGTDTWQNGAMPATWLVPNFKEVVIGWHSFSSQANDMWVDDIVLSDAPIGCE
jgi:hypothetical protein